MRVTPFREFALIQEGNTAAACSLSGALLGFILPLASVIIHSVNLFDMLLRALVALGVQILVYLVVKQFFKQLPPPPSNRACSPRGCCSAPAPWPGILNAACMSY